METKALYIGSFDPVTLGHVDIIKRACAMFEYVEIAVGDNPSKKYMFTFEERVKMMEGALKLIHGGDAGRVGLSRYPINILTADHARKYGFDVIIKGARTNQDFDYEKLIHEISLTQQQKLETVLLFSSAHLSHVSSSAAKELARYQGLIHQYVPIHVKAAIEQKLGQRIIGVTGTIGSGKSTVCKKLGAHHVNMDLMAHELLDEKIVYPMAIETRAQVLKTFGTLDRKILGDRVFGNPEELNKLNAILREPMLTLVREKLSTLKGTILLEGALLAEMNWLFLCNNRVILVKTPSEQEHSNRLAVRGYSPEQMERRVKSQYTCEEKMAAIVEQMNVDQFGKCIMFDTEEDIHEQLTKIRQYYNSDEL